MSTQPTQKEPTAIYEDAAGNQYVKCHVYDSLRSQLSTAQARASAAETALARANAALATVKDRISASDDFSADELIEIINKVVGRFSQGVEWAEKAVIAELQADLATTQEQLRAALERELKLEAALEALALSCRAGAGHFIRVKAPLSSRLDHALEALGSVVTARRAAARPSAPLPTDGKGEVKS